MIEAIFREYDIRGIASGEKAQLNEPIVKAIGLALGQEMLKRGVKSVSVGYDARLSADNLFKWLVSGLNFANSVATGDANSLKIFNIGMAPTPVGYFGVFNDIFDANIMITGSHNPKEYNGFKITIFKDSFFGADLQKLCVSVKQILADKTEINDSARCDNYDILPQYIGFFKEQFSHLNGFKIPLAIDCANGTAAITIEPILKALNIKADILYPTPDGNFPNHHPDPSEEKNLVDLKNALNSVATLAFGFDGDCDRLAVLTKNRVIKGDELAYLYALKMEYPRVLGEVKCSQNMFNEIGKFGTAIMGKTGHSNIKKAMKELNIDLAAEVSGHIFFKERFFGFDDAVYAAFRVLELIYLGVDLDAELDKLPKLFSTDELKIQTSDELKFRIIKDLKEAIASCANTCENSSRPNSSPNGDLDSLVADLPEIKNIIDIDGVRIKFADGWALARASNTTPVIVTRFEANSQKSLENIQNCVQNLLNKIKSRYE